MATKHLWCSSLDTVWTVSIDARQHRPRVACHLHTQVTSYTSQLATHCTHRQAVLRRSRGHLPLRFTYCHPSPHIQKLADHSDVISEVPKCSKIQIFRGSAPDPTGEAYSAPQTSSWWEGLAASAKKSIPALGPSGLVSTGPITELATLLNDRFQV